MVGSLRDPAPDGSLHAATPAGRRACSKRCVRLARLDVRGPGALVAGLDVVGHLGALGEAAEALAADAVVMDEDVLRAVIGRDEPEALVVTEPLHGSGWHVVPRSEERRVGK